MNTELKRQFKAMMEIEKDDPDNRREIRAIALTKAKKHVSRMKEDSK